MPEAEEAEELFVLMTGRYRVSRNTRAQWFFNHINKIASCSKKESMEEFVDEIEIVSVLPSNYQRLVEDEEGRGPFLITQNTKVTFLAQRYRLAFVLDFSPSMTTVDTQSNKVLYEEVFTALSRSLQGLAQPFFVPGSRLLFKPEIFVSVLAHTPFFTSEGQQVVAQGWKLTTENVESLIELLKVRLRDISNSVSRVTAKANEEREERFRNLDILNLESLFNESESTASCLSIPPDIGMVNMFRSGLLALQLLPPQSNAGLVLISDGMLTLPSASILESMLTQSRNYNISCSFLHVGSGSHPHSCFGYMPYTDLMKFITTATFGAYLDSCPEVKEPSEYNYSTYHRAFLVWNFQRGLHGFKCDAFWDKYRNQSHWKVNNPYFYSVTDQLNRFVSEDDPQKKDQKFVKSLLIKNRVANTFTSVLSCRLREGYTIKSVSIFPTTSQIQVTLILPWKHNVNIEYILRAPWNTRKAEGESHECYYEVSYEGSYWFLHDITCLAKKRIRSSYRWATIQQFWTTIKNLEDADKFLAHLCNFSKKGGSEVPEPIKKSSSLFIQSPENDLSLSPENSAFQQFASYWKHICLLDINVWHKWMHTHRINLILKHDLPLPVHLHQPNSSGHFFHIQCIKAMSALSLLLREFSSFVLLENHSYIKIIHISATGTGSTIPSFFMIRVTTTLPCVVLNIAFIGGTPGDLRHKIVAELKEKINECKFSSYSADLENTLVEGDHPSLDPSYTSCCILTRKPVDKILIKYDSVPNNFSTSFESYFHDSVNFSSGITIVEAATDTLATLSRYLHHERRVWITKRPFDVTNLSPLTNVLSKLMKKRLEEGFSVVYNKDGIINMMLEVEMVVKDDFIVPCVIQYLIFPVQTTPSFGREVSTDPEVLSATDDQHEPHGQVLTEYWIEPQVGHCRPKTDAYQFMNGCDFRSIGEAIFSQDLHVLEASGLLHPMTGSRCDE